MRDGLTMRSTHGAFVVSSGGRLFGPFDGQYPAEAFRKELRRAGIVSELVPLWSPFQGREELRVRAGRKVSQPQVRSRP